MKKIVSRGIVILVGALSLPLAMSPRISHHQILPYQNDPRLEQLRKFFADVDCPAQHYAAVFLKAADDYALDWRLLPSISFIESTGGKTARDNNFFGWDSGRAKFASPAAAIHIVAYRLTRGQRFRDKTLDQKLATYNSETGYARRIKSVMRRIAPSD